MSPKSGDLSLPSHLQSDARPSSAPPIPARSRTEPDLVSRTPPEPATHLSVQRVLSAAGVPPTKGQTDLQELDIMPQLLRSGPSVVKTRQGSVLSRGFILKTDYWPSGESQVASTTGMTRSLIDVVPSQAEPWTSSSTFMAHPTSVLRLWLSATTRARRRQCPREGQSHRLDYQ